MKTAAVHRGRSGPFIIIRPYHARIEVLVMSWPMRAVEFVMSSLEAPKPVTVYIYPVIAAASMYSTSSNISGRSSTA